MQNINPRYSDCTMGQRGVGMIELLVTITIFTILTAIGLSSFDNRRYDIDSTVRRVTADFRWARARAIVSGDHFGFHVTGDNTYQIEHLEEVDGEWAVKSVIKRTSLPSHIGLAFAEDLTELDSRGVVVFADPTTAAPASWTVNDAQFAATRTLTLYPSGQLYANH
jgi:prepilin-type N-terminal cleavage/methylation domain-containing protein